MENALAPMKAQHVEPNVHLSQSWIESLVPRELRDRFNQQYHNSLTNGSRVKCFAGSKPDEYFAKLTICYFGTHGDMNMTGPNPENGTEGLKKYDPEAFKLFDDFYQGRILVEPVIPRKPLEGEDD